MKDTFIETINYLVFVVEARIQKVLDHHLMVHRTEFHWLMNSTQQSIHEALQPIKTIVAEVQQSQAKMWCAITKMGEELCSLANQIDDPDERRLLKIQN